MKRLVIVFVMVLNTVLAIGQTLKASAPSRVSVGEQFRLSYTINTQNVSDFHAGNIPPEFEVLIGPNRSMQSSYQMINGHTSSTSSITYTYIVAATKNGSFTIPAAHVVVDGKKIASNTLTIKVTGSSSTNGNSSRHNYNEGEDVRDMGSRISGSDLFIKVSANKKRVYEQEPILLTYKVYTLVQLTQLRGNMPDLKSFYTQEVDLPQQKSFSIETVNGRPYRTCTWSQYVMFPQTTGKLQIPAIPFEGIVVQQNRNVDPFEAFFNGGSGYVEVKKKIVAPGLDINVLPLPKRPTGYSGGVGKLNISAQLDKTETKANDPITLRVIVSGTGNLKLIKQPMVTLPKDFDQYDPKVTDHTKLTSAGLEGSKIYDFLIVPRHQGQYEIPPVEFIYFNTDTKSYETLKTQSFKLDVAKGSGSSSVNDFSEQEDLKELNKDIRFIKTGDYDQHLTDEFFYGSTAYWIIIVVLLIVFITLFTIFRQRAIDNANVTKMRGKKANKVATKRLKMAARLMSQNKSSEFYDEVLRALWGYVGDKLNIPVAQLSHDNISMRLSERGVHQSIIDGFIGAIDECEYERYAPGDSKGNMSKVYNKAIEAIEKIENSMKKEGKRKMAVILLMLLVPFAAQAATKAEADSAYVRGEYQSAIRSYESLLKQGVSSELYYNLGNAYYRTDNITRAVLNYERALLLSPGDSDIRFNLQIARSKTIDKIVPESEMFFVTWYHSCVNLMSVDGWGRLALVSLGIIIVLFLVYLFSSRVWMQKLGFFGGIALLVLFVISNFFAWQQRQNLLYRKGAIVVAPSVAVKSTPANNGTDLFVLHEGTKVIITDGLMKNWREIRLADGKKGWLESKTIEII